MAMHTELPIHKVAYDLFNLSIILARNIPRDLKILLGTKIRDECLEVAMLIGRANAAQEKKQYLGTLIEHVHEIELLLRSLKDFRFISVKQYAAAIQLTSSIGKQANAWKRSTPTAPAT
jgi:hypothetical protein